MVPLYAAEKSEGKKNGPPPQDYMGLVNRMGEISQQNLQQQTQANRPNQSTPFANSQWTQGPDGQWSQQVGFNGPLAGLNQSLQQQAASAMGTPFSLEGLPELTTGEQARQQAIDAAMSQAESRLNPRFAQQEEALRNRLLASGLQEGSEAYNRAFDRFGQERNDAFNQAQFSAIGQGTAAGNALFNQSLAARQNALSEALRQRGQAFSELQGMQNFLAMPGFNAAGRGETPDLLGAAGMADQQAMQRWQMQMQMINDMLRAGGQIGMAAASDERLKQSVVRHSHEVLPGVPLATWEWREDSGETGPTVGVLAQDLQQVRPDLVHEREDGMLMVDYGGLMGAMG